MASKLWIYGKKLTLWGALVSSLPFMFIPVMVLSAFGIAISVPLGCAVGGYVCFRKCLSGLSRKRLIACKRENSGMKKNEAEAAGLGECLQGSDVNEECAKITSEPVGHSQVQYEELRSEAGENLDENDRRGEPLIYEEGYEGIIPEVKPLEEEPNRLKSYEEPHHLIKLCEVDTPLKWDPHDLPIVGGQTPSGETHSMQSDQVKVHGGVDQLTWDVHVKISVERRIPEDGTQSKLIDEGTVSEGEPHLMLNPQAILIEKTAAIEQTPKDESRFSQEEEIKASEGDTQLARNPDAWIAVEEYSLEDGIQSKLSVEMEVSEEIPQLTMNPRAIQMENNAAEEQNFKDETKYNLKKEAKASDGETRLTSDNHHALSVEKISPTGTKLRGREEEDEEEESNEMQESPTSESRHELGADLDLEKFSPPDTKHKKREAEEEREEKQSSEMQETTSKKFLHRHGEELDSENLPHRDIKHRRREEDVEKWEEGEESKGMQEFSPNRSRNEQGAELDGEKLYPTKTKYKRRDLDEKEEEKSSKMQEVPSKRSYHEDGRELASKRLSPRDRKHRGGEEDEEEEKKGEISKEMQEIPSDRFSNEQGAELNVEKLSPRDTKHKKGEEDEEEEEEELKSNKLKEVLSKRSCDEQDSEVELAPSTPYIDNAFRDGNQTTPETSYVSAALSIQAVSPHGVSLPGSEYDAASSYNDVTDIETTLSLEVQISSASGSDQDSKSVLESSIELDSDDNDDDGKIWEEIHAVRKIVGYKEDPHPSYAEEIKALYVFTA
ncbi:hypothetical protein SUGI_0529510 [Cryptomeria japonica]|nr:hypothetical protein SUGI_0529510 [Cryptomeria japonica]